ARGHRVGGNRAACSSGRRAGPLPYRGTPPRGRADRSFPTGLGARPVTWPVTRPLRFGVEGVGSRYDARGWRDLAREAEDSGYSTLLLPDHVHDFMAPMTAMMAAAAATSTLRVGTHVLANELRHPALVAKEIATADVLSDGRVELGIGAGWHRGE